MRFNFVIHSFKDLGSFQGQEKDYMVLFSFLCKEQ